MQRLFTTFAGGWPGYGLLIQRVATGLALLHNAIVFFAGPHRFTILSPQAIGAMLAVFLVIGLWTPVAGGLITIVEIWACLTLSHSGETILLAALGVTLAMIGPGAFSIDAQLFGRKHLRS